MSDEFKPEPGLGEESAEGEEKKDVKERIAELQMQGLSREDIAYQLMQEGYGPQIIAKALRVSGRTLARMKRERQGALAGKDADEVVMKAAEVATLEDLKKWAEQQTHLTLTELLHLGRVLHDLGVRERAAARGVPLTDYVERALNFYHNYYDTCAELFRLGVFDMDGHINEYALAVQEVERRA
jgi:hypothetical protein